MKNSLSQSIVFFDGECHLCNSFARFIIRRCKNIQVASLQSDMAKSLLNKNYEALQQLNTLVLFEDNTIHIKTDAILHIINKMNGLWPLLNVFKLVPLSFRDKCYDLIAKNRHRFSKSDNCMLQNNAKTQKQ